MQKLLMLRVEPHDGTLQENAKDAIMMAMRLNCKVIFTFDKQNVIADPYKDPMEITGATKAVNGQ